MPIKRHVTFSCAVREYIRKLEDHVIALCKQRSFYVTHLQIIVFSCSRVLLSVFEQFPDVNVSSMSSLTISVIVSLHQIAKLAPDYAQFVIRNLQFVNDIKKSDWLNLTNLPFTLFINYKRITNTSIIRH